MSFRCALLYIGGWLLACEPKYKADWIATNLSQALLFASLVSNDSATMHDHDKAQSARADSLRLRKMLQSLKCFWKTIQHL